MSVRGIVLRGEVEVLEVRPGGPAPTAYDVLEQVRREAYEEGLRAGRSQAAAVARQPMVQMLDVQLSDVGDSVMADVAEAAAEFLAGSYLSALSDYELQAALSDVDVSPLSSLSDILSDVGGA